MYALIEKTDRASRNGIFVFAFASLQTKIVCGIQNKFIDEAGFQVENKHTERFRREIANYECLCRNQRRSSMLPMGWSVFSADPCIWKLGERQQAVCGGREILGSLLSPFSPHRDFVTKNYEALGICGRKIPIQSDLSVGCEAECNFSTDRRCPRTALEIGTDEVTGFHRQWKSLPYFEQTFRSDGQTARIWHCVVWVSDACHRAGTRWEASADHRTNLF